MDARTLKEKILEVLKGRQLASLATVEGDRPWVRYVILYNDDMTFYVCTSRATRKVEQIKVNPNVHVTTGGDPLNYDRPFINIAGTATILADMDTKKTLWRKIMSRYFKDQYDQDYVVLRIDPEFIEYWTITAREPEVLRFDRSK